MKKLVFVLAIAMIATGAFARDFVSPAGSIVNPGTGSPFVGDASQIKMENWEWPIDDSYIPFVWQKMCTFDVLMDVGYWIQIDNCKALKMKLKQQDINTYKGKVDVKFTANAEFEVSASFDKDGAVNLGDKWGKDISWTPDNIVTPGPSTKTLNLTLKSVKLDQLVGGQNCLKVGTMTISVRPHVLFKDHVCWGDTCGQGDIGQN